MTPPASSLADRITKQIIDRVPAARAFGGSDGIKASADALREGRDAAGGSAPFAADIARAVPHLPSLLYGLVRDPKVPLRYRAGLIGATGLAISPLDAIPDFIPVIGAVDDIVLVLLAVRWVLHGLALPTLRRHWKGSDDAFEALLRVSGRPNVPTAVDVTEPTTRG